MNIEQSSSIIKQLLPINKATLKKTIVSIFKSIEFHVDSISFNNCQCCTVLANTNSYNHKKRVQRPLNNPNENHDHCIKKVKFDLFIEHDLYKVVPRQFQSQSGAKYDTFKARHS